MQALDQQYLDALESIAEAIQSSDALARYLDEEEEADYTELKDAFEPEIATVHEHVAAHEPLQLIPLELMLLNEQFEGLFLPRILGFSVLRGEVNDQVKYVRPQTHFKQVLTAICNSANFDILKKRIGQAIQVGLSLSSDIWVTDLINQFDNKRVRYYLQGHKVDKYRYLNGRAEGLRRFKKQFEKENFQTADFPTTPAELHVLYSSLKEFLLYRFGSEYDNSSLIEPLMDFARNDHLKGTDQYLDILAIFASFSELEEDNEQELKTILNAVRKEYPIFDEVILQLIHDLHERDDVNWTPEADKRLSELLDRSQTGKLNNYLDAIDVLHRDGYASEAAQEAVRVQHAQHEGLSMINDNLRQTVYQYFERLLTNLEPEDYPDFFELPKYYTTYMDIFNNEQFNLQLKSLSMAYVKRLLKRYTDKRGKDYQDIKKFVRASFQDLGFLTEKQVVELFKTRRKRKPKVE